MKIEYLHASKYGNGARVAGEFKDLMSAADIAVDVHHVRDVKPTELAPADLYVFSSPGRMGQPLRRVRRFLAKVTLPVGTRYAILTTEMAPKPGKQPSSMQRVVPTMNEILQERGLVNVADGTVYVTGYKGPLEDGWESKVEAFASTLRTAQSKVT